MIDRIIARAAGKETPRQFTVSLAGIPVRVTCRHKENRRFLRDYLTDREPFFAVSPTESDIERMQAEYDRWDEAEGRQKQRRTDRLLENNAIHALLAEGLADYGILLMHGSALCMDGKAYIFTAPSGTGKSTHARLWQEAFGDRVWILNDDKPLLQLTESGVTVWGSPWSGKNYLSRNDSAPLKAIAGLHRAETNRIERMDRADAFLLLLRQRYDLKNAAAARKIVELQTALLERTEFYKLYCNMETDAARIAWKGMSGS